MDIDNNLLLEHMTNTNTALAAISEQIKAIPEIKEDMKEISARLNHQVIEKQQDQELRLREMDHRLTSVEESRKIESSSKRDIMTKILGAIIVLLIGGGATLMWQGIKSDLNSSNYNHVDGEKNTNRE